jgi:hypothetical protein
MKKIFVTFCVLVVVNSYAHTEHIEAAHSAPTSQEIGHNRACFEDLAKLGCGDPGEDIKHFRSCLHETFSFLTGGCQKLMTDLYTRKN